MELINTNKYALLISDEVRKVFALFEPGTDYNQGGFTSSQHGFLGWKGMILNAKLEGLPDGEVIAEGKMKGKIGIVIPDVETFERVVARLRAHQAANPKPERGERTSGPKPLNPQTMLANRLVETRGRLGDLKAQAEAHSWGVNFDGLYKELDAIDTEAQPLAIGPANNEAIKTANNRLDAFDEAKRKFEETDIFEARIDKTEKWLTKIEGDGVLGIVTGKLRASLTDLLAAIQAGTIGYPDANAMLRSINADLGKINPAAKSEANRPKPIIHGRGGNDRGQRPTSRPPVKGGATLEQVVKHNATSRRDSR